VDRCTGRSAGFSHKKGGWRDDSHPNSLLQSNPSQHPIHIPLYKKGGWRDDPHPNSLLTGKITGNFEKNAPPGDFHFEINKRFQLFAAKIPYATEQGIFRGVSGKIFQGTGNL
jgi:hypothetical protein